MPGMAIFEFVRKVHHQRMTIPVILIAEDVTTELARESIGNGVCFLFSKPLSDRDIMYTWQHIYRVTGELPALTDITSSIDREEYGSLGSGNSCGGAAINRNPRNMKRKIMNIDEENNTDEDVGRNPRKSRMFWTTFLNAKFLQAINILGECSAHPNAILGMMKEPGLTKSQVSSHLQIYRKHKRLHPNPQETTHQLMSAVLPTVLPRSPIWPNAPTFVGYTIEYVKEKLDASNYSGDSAMKAISNNGAVQVGEGDGGVKIAHRIDPKHKSNENGNASTHMTNGFQAPNVEPIGVQVAEGDGGKSAEGTDKNYNSTENVYAREQAPLVPQIFSTRIQASGPLTNGLQDPNQEPTRNSETGMLGFGNAGNRASMNHAYFGESTSANHQFSEMSGNDDINKIIQELEASEVDLWDLIN